MKSVEDAATSYNVIRRRAVRFSVQEAGVCASAYLETDDLTGDGGTGRDSRGCSESRKGGNRDEASIEGALEVEVSVVPCNMGVDDVRHPTWLVVGFPNRNP